MEIKNKYVNKGIDYIVDNLENELKVEDVARYCHLSKFHFTRLFKEETGDSVYAMIKKMKMEESAIVLGMNMKNSITEVGMNYGYSSSNYSSAFSKHHGISPTQFRRLEKYKNNNLQSPLSQPFFYENPSFYADKVRVTEFDSNLVIYKRYIGNYNDMGVLWPDFIEEYRDYFKDDSQLIEVCYNDPNITDGDRCIFDLCLKVDQLTDAIKTRANTKLIKGGRYCSYHFKGSESEMIKEYKGFLYVWFPKSGLVLDRRVRFDSYKLAEPSHDYFEVDINIPIK
ncbi:AraC family transcriptional regulator [Agarivorans sp. QJM3NY_25]|uniref:AraC family transcriptional regulator n=1 Tax=Agarivorans sp. QJM3NY_25 TaxID=3421430 RepID=UPI003D7DB3F8